MKSPFSMLFALLMAVPLFGASAAAPVATIGTSPITQDDLDHAVGAKLTRIHTEEYNVRRGVLDEMIATRLLESEAARRQMTVEELLKTEVENKITPPNIAEIEPIYEGVADRYPGLTKEQALAEISESMRRSRIANRRGEFVKELRSAAGVRVYLQPPRADVQAVGPSRGSAGAPVTIVEFSDFECPFCGRAAETLAKIEQSYAGKVRVVFRDFPLAMHRTAKRASQASHCAEEQGKFWEMHDKLFSKGGALGEPDLFRFAQQIKLDPEAFDRCMKSDKFREAWKPSQEEGMRVGVQSTPTFFINGRLIVGAASFEAFSRVIEEELAAPQQRPEAKVAGK